LLVDNSKDDSYFKRIKSLGLNAIKDEYFEKARERIVHSRNILRKIVLEKGYDYFLSLEQDVIPPKDVIEKLIRHEKKVVSGVYFSRYKINGKIMYLPLLWKEKKDNKKLMRFLKPEEIEGDKLIKIKKCGLGCVLIRRDVLEKIKFRYVEEILCFDDMFFCEDVEKNGFGLYCDASVKCKHLISGMSWKNIKK